MKLTTPGIKKRRTEKHIHLVVNISPELTEILYAYKSKVKALKRVESLKKWSAYHYQFAEVISKRIIE